MQVSKIWRQRVKFHLLGSKFHLLKIQENELLSKKKCLYVHFNLLEAGFRREQVVSRIADVCQPFENIFHLLFWDHDVNKYFLKQIAQLCSSYWSSWSSLHLSLSINSAASIELKEAASYLASFWRCDQTFQWKLNSRQIKCLESSKSKTSRQSNVW